MCCTEHYEHSTNEMHIVGIIGTIGDRSSIYGKEIKGEEIKMAEVFATITRVSVV